MNKNVKGREARIYFYQRSNQSHETLVWCFKILTSSVLFWKYLIYIIKNRWEEIKLFQLDGWLQKQSDTLSFLLHLMFGLMGLPYGRFIHLVKIPTSCFWTTGKSMSFFSRFYINFILDLDLNSKFYLRSFK